MLPRIIFHSIVKNKRCSRNSGLFFFKQSITHDKPARHFGSLTAVHSQSHSTGLRSMGPLQQHALETVEHVHMPSDIVFEDMIINHAQQLKVKPKADASVLKFGAVTTDHMLQITWNEEQGWMAPTINPLQPLTLHPCAQVLHYATECFEGMKAYKDKDGRIRLFRPDMHLERLLRSVRRLALPEFDKVALLDCIEELLRVERDWIPEKEGFSIYIRPTVIATHASLGVQPPKEAMLFVVLSPVGPYFPTGLQPIKLFVDTRNARAFPGGVGDKKLGANYAPTIVPQVAAARHGCSQVLYVLNEKHGGFIGESGSMNIFFLMRDHQGSMELVTPPLDGMILPGVTRDTVLKISSSIKDLKVSERPLPLSEVEAAAKEGRLLEAFGTGTACMIQPISGLLKDDGITIEVPFDTGVANYWIRKAPGTLLASEPRSEHQEAPFNLCGFLTRAMMDIQYGHTQSTNAKAGPTVPARCFAKQLREILQPAILHASDDTGVIDEFDRIFDWCELHRVFPRKS